MCVCSEDTLTHPPSSPSLSHVHAHREGLTVLGAFEASQVNEMEELLVQWNAPISAAVFFSASALQKQVLSSITHTLNPEP